MKAKDKDEDARKVVDSVKPHISQTTAMLLRRSRTGLQQLIVFANRIRSDRKSLRSASAPRCCCLDAIQHPRELEALDEVRLDAEDVDHEVHPGRDVPSSSRTGPSRARE